MCWGRIATTKRAGFGFPLPLLNVQFRGDDYSLLKISPDVINVGSSVRVPSVVVVCLVLVDGV